MPRSKATERKFTGIIHLKNSPRNPKKRRMMQSTCHTEGDVKKHHRYRSGTVGL